jgi:hypothetical protein
MLGVNLVNALDSRSLSIGQAFDTVLAEDLVVDGSLVARAGSPATGVVRDLQLAGRVDGVETLVVALTSLEAEDGRRYPLTSSTNTYTAEKTTKRDAVTVGAASAVGALIGGIAKGGKGAATGAAAGAAAGAGVVLTTRGEPVHLQPGTWLGFTLEDGLRIPVPEQPREKPSPAEQPFEIQPEAPTNIAGRG